MPGPDIPRMDPATIVASARTLRQDIADDVEKFDGMDFTSENVALLIGGIVGQLDYLTVMVGALARVVQEP
jgi:hypothetical protein